MNYIRLQGRVNAIIRKAANDLKLTFRRKTPSSDPLAEIPETIITQELYAVFLGAGYKGLVESILQAVGQTATEKSDAKLLISPVGVQWDLKSGDEVQVDGKWLGLGDVDRVRPDLKTTVLIKANIRSM